MRHTRGTYLFGETGDRELAKMWLSHGSDKVFERYNHTYEELARAKKRSRLKKGEDFNDWFFKHENEKESSFSLTKAQKELMRSFSYPVDESRVCCRSLP